MHIFAANIILIQSIINTAFQIFNIYNNMSLRGYAYESSYVPNIFIDLTDH